MTCVDTVLDCIPFVSQSKNAAILLYQTVHKVNRVANPGQIGFAQHLKVVCLSKELFQERLWMFPLLGNLPAIMNNFTNWGLCGPNLLNRAVLQKEKMPHYFEIASYCLKEKPSLVEEDPSILADCAAKGDLDLFKMIYSKKKAWEPCEISAAFLKAKDASMMQFLLLRHVIQIRNKDLIEKLSALVEEGAEDAFMAASTLNIPDPMFVMEKPFILSASSKKAKRIFFYFLKKFPWRREIVHEALLAGAKIGHGDLVQALIKKFPHYANELCDPLIREALLHEDENHLIFLVMRFHIEQKMLIKAIRCSQTLERLLKASVRLAEDPHFESNLLDLEGYNFNHVVDGWRRVLHHLTL